MKKIISAILAGACAVSAMSIAASAATAANKAATSGTDVKLTAAMVPVVPVIDVTVPSAITAVLNPFGIAVKDKAGNEYGATGVTSPIYTIVNKTTTSAVVVQAKATVSFPTEVIPDDANKQTRATIKLDTKANVKTANDTKGTASVNKNKMIYMAVAVSGSSDPVKIANVDTTGKNGLASTPANQQQEGWTYTANATNGTVDVASLDPMLDLTAEQENKDGAQDTPFAFTDVTTTKVWNNSKLEANTPATPDYSSMVVIGTAVPDPGVDTTPNTADDVPTFTYAQFQLTGDLNTNATYTSSDKVSVNLILNIQPSGATPTPAETLA